MKKRTKRLLAMLLASAMIMQQGSTVGVLATESEPASETAAETTATEAETKTPETKAPETQAPETKAPETQAVSETQATEAATSAAQTETATSETTETTEKVTEAAATEATEAPAETGETPDAEADTDDATEKADEAEETEAPKTNFTYEDNRVKITAVAQEAAKLPQDAQIHADYMKPGTPEYQAAAAALEAAYAGKDVVLSYVFYDIYFTAASAGNGRIEPEAGTVTVSMQFKQPELKPETDAEVQTYDVVHVENGKAQEVPSNVKTTGDGSVASVGFTSGDFSPYAVVMTVEEQDEVATIEASEPTERIASGNPFEKLDGAKNVTSESGMQVEKFTISKSGNGDIHAGDTGYSVELGVSYKGNLKDPKQVYFVELEGLEEYFDIDTARIPTSAEGCGEILDGDSVMGHWFVDMESNKIYFVFDRTEVNALNPFVNLHFSANAKANSSGEKEKVEFKVGGQDFSFEWYPEKSEMSVEKEEGKYNEETGEVNFTVTVTSTKGTNTVKSLSDYYKHLSFQEGETTVEVKKSGGEPVPSKTVVKDNNFVTTLDEEVKLEEGDTLTFTYKMKIDKSKAVNGVNVAENTATLNFTDNWHEGESKNSAKWTKEFNASRPDVTKTLDSYTPPTGSTTGTATWTILVEKGDDYLEKGSTIVDDSWNFDGVTLGEDNEKFKKAAVTITYKDGDTERTLNIKIEDLGIDSGDGNGAVKINPNGKNFSIDFGKVAEQLKIKNIESCEIKYSTEVDMGDLQTGESQTVTNNVTVEKDGIQTDSDSKDIEVSNDNESGLAVTKTHDDNITEVDSGSGVKKVEWISRLTIKPGNYKKLWFHDRATADPNNVTIDGKSVYLDWFDISTIDSAPIDNNSIITSIVIPEDANGILNKNEFTIEATDKDGERYGETLYHGFKLTLLNSETEKEFTKSVTIEIHYVSYFDQKLLANGSWLGNATKLENTATFSNEKGSVSAVDSLTSGFVMGGVNKGTYGSNNEDGYINWTVKVKADVLKKLYFNEANSKWHWPDRIYFTDILPENMKLLTFDNGKGSTQTKVGYNYGSGDNGNTYLSNAMDDFYVQDNGRKLTVDVLDVLKTLYEGKSPEEIGDVTFVYKTQIVDYDQYLKDGKKAYSNEVTLHCGEKVTFSHSASAELTPGGSLSKAAADPESGYVKFTISGFGTMIANLHKSDPKYVEAKLVDVYGSALRYDPDKFDPRYGDKLIPKDADTSSAGVYYTVDDLTHQIEFHITNLDSVKVGDTITYSLKMIPTAHEEGSDSGYYKNTVWLYGYEEYKKETSARESTSGATGGSTAVYLSILKKGIYTDSEGEEKTENLNGIKFSLYSAELTSEGKLKIAEGGPLDTVSTLEGGRASFSCAVTVNKLYAITEDASTTPDRYQAMEPQYVLFRYKDAVGDPGEELIQKYTDLGVSIREVDDTKGNNIPITLELENREKASLGSLTVTKVVIGNKAPTTAQYYTVTVTASDEEADLSGVEVEKLAAGKEATIKDNTITFEISASDTVELSKLPLGEYTVTETVSGKEYTATYKVDGDTASPAKVTFSNAEGGKLESAVAITNDYGNDYGKLTVTKAVIGNKAPATAKYYTVTVTASDTAANLSDVKVENLAAGKKATLKDNTITFEISASDTVELSKLPLGEYTVTETVSGKEYTATYKVDGDTASPAKVTFSNAEGGKLESAVAITNDYGNDYGKLTVTKAVIGNKAPATAKYYTVTVRASDTAANLSDVKVENLAAGKKATLKDNTITFEISASDTVELSKLPLGEYTVTEMVSGTEYTATYKIDGKTAKPAKVTFSNAEGGKLESAVEITNDYGSDVGTLLVEKVVIGTKAPTPVESYDVTVMTTDTGIDLSAESVTVSEAVEGSVKQEKQRITFQIMGNTTVTVNGLPLGKYTVTETVNGTAYSASYKVDGVSATSPTVTFSNIEPKKSQAKVEITNDYGDKTGSLKITKKVTLNGEATTGTEADGTYTFNLTKEGDSSFNKTVTIKIENGKSKTETVSDLIPGVYTVSEVVPTGMTLTGANNITLTVTADNTTNIPMATFTNNKKMAKISIQKVYKDEGGTHPLAGAKLVVRDSEGKIVEGPWVSEVEPHVFTGLAPGTYTLSELEAPKGYDVAKDVSFEIKGTETSKNPIEVEMTDTKTKSTTYSLTVTKHVRLDGFANVTGDVGISNETFYVALFSDSDRTQRVSDVKKIEFKNALAGSVTFENLDPTLTYYVGETDVNGTMVPAAKVEGSDMDYYAEYGGKSMFKFEGPTTHGLAEFTNVFVKWPDYLYLSGQLTVTKKVLLNGEPATSTDTFYARVFSDAGLTQPVSEILALSMAGGSEASVLVTNLPIGNTVDSSAKYYVAETDAYGTPLDPSAVTEYTISVDKSEVTLSGSYPSDTVVITNDFTEKESEFESEESEFEESESETEVAKKTAPKTGDDTDFMKYLLLMALSAGACAVIFEEKRRRNQTRQ